MISRISGVTRFHFHATKDRNKTKTGNAELYHNVNINTTSTLCRWYFTREKSPTKRRNSLKNHICFCFNMSLLELSLYASAKLYLDTWEWGLIPCTTYKSPPPLIGLRDWLYFSAWLRKNVFIPAWFHQSTCVRDAWKDKCA